MPIAWSQPSGIAFRRSEKSWLTNKILAVESKEPGHVARLLRCRRSRCYRLRLQEPDSELEALRGLRPPELPAGKRGGWHHDSVYPSFRLTSFAPRALNFWVSVPAVRSALDFSLDATQTCRRSHEACNWVVRRARR